MLSTQQQQQRRRFHHLFLTVLISLSCHTAFSFIIGTNTNTKNRISSTSSLLLSAESINMVNQQSSSSQSLQNIEAIIFDIDGTLADSWKLCFDATQVVLENNNLPTITTEIYHQCTRYSTPHRLAIHAGLSLEDDNFDSVGNRLGQEFDDLYVGLVSKQTAGFYNGIDQVLQKIMTTKRVADNDSSAKEIKLACLTNACVAYAHAVLKVNSFVGDNADTVLYEKFLSIHGADSVPAPKPEPDGLYQICKELNVQPENAVYVGDSPSDALAADAAGMPSIGVTWGSHSEEGVRKAAFTYVATSIDELAALLNL